MDSETMLPYLPLAEGTKQIRLITVLPDERMKPIKCTLSHEDLGAKHHRPYETISYCWGDARIRGVIIVNGVSCSVPASSEAALRSVRLRNEARTVWLDAVCINQSNIEERGQQVSIMGDVYRNGSQNLVYLGEKDVSEAMGSVKDILEEAMATEGSFKNLRNELGFWEFASTGIKAKYDVKALIGLYQLPWFRRTWVLQEAALAKSNRCFCGSTEFSLLDVTRAAAWLKYSFCFVDPVLIRECTHAADFNDLIDPTYGYYASKNQAPGALFLLALSQNLLATEPIDKLYGILALTTSADGTKELDIVTDYKKTIAEAFGEAHACLIRTDGDLAFLRNVIHRDGRHAGAAAVGDNFPSWIPKWHIGTHDDPAYLSGHYDASAGRKSSAHNLNSGGVTRDLVVDGFKISSVSEVGERMMQETFNNAGLTREILCQVHDMVSRAGDAVGEHRHDRDPAHETAFSMLDVASTLVAGHDFHRGPVTPNIAKSFSALCDLLRVTGTTGDQVPPELPPTLSQLSGDEHPHVVNASQYRQAMTSTCIHRAFFTADVGIDGRRYIGLGPHFMQQGDIIVILYGLRWPAVLRLVENGKWVFLALCYVAGIMFGEAVRENDERKKDGQGGDCSFTLC